MRLKIRLKNRSYAMAFVLGSILILSACVMSPPVFDEAQWKETVAGQDPAKLYARNDKNGVYYNPWMPMQQKRLGEFLNWRFSRKARYSDDESTYLPAIIPNLGDRIRKESHRDFINWMICAKFPRIHPYFDRNSMSTGTHYYGTIQSAPSVILLIRYRETLPIKKDLSIPRRPVRMVP